MPGLNDLPEELQLRCSVVFVVSRLARCPRYRLHYVADLPVTIAPSRGRMVMRRASPGDTDKYPVTRSRRRGAMVLHHECPCQERDVLL
jgi:hypothetical protein